MNRGAQGTRLFADDADCRAFIDLLRKFTVKCGLRVFAYCVMPNHFHALVRGSGGRLTRCFHEVDRLWARAYNDRRNSRGHVFQGSFLSFRQHSEGWFVRTSMYIHMNPAGKRCPRPEDYRWRAGLKPEKEAAVLEAWHARAKEAAAG